MSTVKSKKLQVGTDATATNNFTIYQPATPDGTLRVGVGNADSPTEVGQFNSNGYKPALTCAFHIKKTDTQNISNATTTKITWSSAVYDLNSDFDLTNNRFVAPVNGIYQFSVAVGVNIPDGTRQGTQIIVNNDTNFRFWNLVGTADSTCNVQNSISLKLDANDYVEAEIYQDGGSTETVVTSTNITYFMGTLIYQI